jgi:hypothetical protein
VVTLSTLRAEWTKFRTVRAWLFAAAAAAILLVLFGLIGASGSKGSSGSGGGAAPIGPDGESVNDRFYFVHQPLAKDGSLTVRVTTFTGRSLLSGGPSAAGTPQPWAKAGVIIKDGTTPGSAYAAVMVTGGHGVRMQYNYTEDVAGPPDASWLRLTRTGDTITGYASSDGTMWTLVGTARLPGLPDTVECGLFVASPFYEQFEQHLGGIMSNADPTVATATFDSLDVQGVPSGGTWNGLEVGADPPGQSTGGFDASGGRYTVSGSGNIAPVVPGPERSIERTLVGAFIAMTVLVVVAVLFITTEYRRGLIRSTLTANPKRNHVLAAKATVIAVVTFVVGLIGAAVALPLTSRIMRDNGISLAQVSSATEVRVVVGTAALLAMTAVFGLALGTILRRSVVAIAATLVLTVLPYLFTVSGVLPVAAATWVLRVSPAAAFAVQQGLRAYPQVDQAYTPAFGFYPLAPWAGFAVLCAWTAVALGVAAYLLRRRDI